MFTNIKDNYYRLRNLRHVSYAKRELYADMVKGRQAPLHAMFASAQSAEISNIHVCKKTAVRTPSPLRELNSFRHVTQY